MLQQGLGTLDSKINQKAGVLRSNPQAMGQLQQQQKTQQSKGVTPDLLEALAVQKALADKATAKQQLALSQQQEAGTVAEQMEQKLVGMNKEELTAQTAGIMGERNKKRQQQTSAAKPPQPQGQRPPMPQGAPQGLAAAPRPPMQMAQGGIIGYKKGDKVSAVEAKGSRLEQALKAMGILYEDYMAMRPEQKKGLEAQIQKEYIKQRKEFEVPELPISGMLDRAMQPTPERAASDAAAKANYDEKQARGLSTITDPKTGQGFNAAPEEYIKRMKDTEVDPSVIVKNPLTAQPVGVPVDPTAPAVGVPVDPNAPAVGVPADPNAVVPPKLDNAPDLSGVREAALSDRLKPELEISKGIASVNMGEEKQKELSRVSGPAREEIMGPDGKPTGKFKELGGFNRKSYDDQSLALRKEKDALEKELLDPSKVKKAKYNKWMEAVQGGGLKAGRGALNKFDTDREARRRKSLEERQALFDKDSERNITTANNINVEAGKTVKDLMLARSEAIKVVATVKQGDIENMRAEVKQLYDSNQNGIKNRLTNDANIIQKELQTLIQNQASAAQVIQLLTKFAEMKRKSMDTFLEPYKVELGNLSAELSKAETQTERDGIKENIKQYTLMFIEAWELSGSNDLEDKVLSAAGVTEGSTAEEDNIVVGADTEDRLTELLGK